MSSHGRIWTIYAKELVDILRDRRTLIAMIVVPIVLYPLLMLGSVQAVSYQAESMEDELLVIGVVGEQQRKVIDYLIGSDAERLERQRARLDPESREANELPTPIARAELVVYASQAELEQAVRDRLIHAGVLLDREKLDFSLRRTHHVTISADLEDVRGNFAARKLEEVFMRKGERTVANRLQQNRIPVLLVKPIHVVIKDFSSPPSILGQILPLILILLTITGAIYPAIDLTAGERERGTLESLMVCPVPVIDLVVGKFLVVTTVAIMGATLNLASVTATVYFGGFDRVIASSGEGVPLIKMVLILACLVPFAVLMSAIMLAVCSCARTFKEAQNYVTPVILAVLIPGGIAALPATRMEGIMLVMPVGNMVLLARELLLGSVIPGWQFALVLLSTTLYAGAAVAVAASLFGRESVVFADAASLKSLLSRRLVKPTGRPSISMGLLFIALLFPAWFFLQSSMSPALGVDEDAGRLLYTTAWMMPLMFVGVPIVALWYWKVDVAATLAWRLPAARYLLAGVLIGVSAWVPAHELNVYQQAILGVPQIVVDSTKLLARTLAALPPTNVFLVIALIPAICEELLFRGFLLSALRQSAHKWSAILLSAAIFGVFHFFLFKFAITATLGVVLAYLCWQSGSILPAILAHLLHNAVAVLSVVRPGWEQHLGIPADATWTHLPIHVLLIGSAVFVIGLTLIARRPSASTSTLRAAGAVAIGGSDATSRV